MRSKSGASGGGCVCNQDACRKAQDGFGLVWCGLAGAWYCATTLEVSDVEKIQVLSWMARL